MDLLACSECDHRFYVQGVGPPESRFCPHCGGGLALAVHCMTSIPIDARWLDPRAGPTERPEVTVVELRGKRKRDGKTGKRIVRDLADYFAVEALDGSVKVSVNRGAPADAALRVAAVLDGVDTGWEDHFYLPTADSQAPRDLQPPPPRARGHLRLIASNGDGILAQGSA
jgi:ribosomal protein S27AE